MGLLLLTLASRVIPGSESLGTNHNIFLPQIPDSPNLEVLVYVFISPRNRVLQLYIASFYTQGYGGGIETRLHTGIPNFLKLKLKLKLKMKLRSASQYILMSGPHLGTLTRFFSYTYFCLTIAGFLLWGRPL
jgi:hypothetical protein